MKLLRLYIQGCGVFQRTLIDLTHNGEPQNMLCLAGVNGSGKTTVMELLFNLVILLDPNLSLRSFYFDRLKPHVLTRTKFAQLNGLIDGKVFSLVIGKKSDIIRDKDNDKNQAFIIEPEVSSLISYFENIKKTGENNLEIFKSLEIFKEVESISETRFSKRNLKIMNAQVIQPLLDKIKNALSNENQAGELPSIYFFNAHDREILDIRYSSIPRWNPKYQLAHRYGQKTDDLKKTLIYYDYAYPEKFEALKEWLNQHVLVDKNIERVDRPNFNVLIKTKHGNTHGLELLSSGEESLLILATQIYLNTSSSSVVLIDEVDQSLHPEFQEKAMTLLFQLQKDKECQIIVSSHSEIVWNFFKSRGFIDLTEMVM